MGKAFRGVRNTGKLPQVQLGHPDNPLLQNTAKSGGSPPVTVKQWIGGRGRPLNLQRRG